jgi:F-type H+-transporting ATPase subunit a
MRSFFNRISPFSLVLSFFFVFGTLNFSKGQEQGHEEVLSELKTEEFEEGKTEEPAEESISDLILHHVKDDHVWHLWDGHHGTIFLPVIVYSSEKGLDVFSSRHFYNEHHKPTLAYEGYIMEHNHIEIKDSEAFVLDLSITKNVAMLFINALLLVGVFLAVAKGAKSNSGKAPKGIQSFFEPIIVFVRDEIVKPNIGHQYNKFLPYMLTLFFFILFGNLLGLLPGAGNLTGNIAVTLTLAVLTFIITNVKGNKGYWSHIFWTPGVPLPLRLVIMPVEILGIFTKPFSLTVRLFVAVTAGHIVLLSLLSLTFIFESYAVGFVSSVIVLFIDLIELLVAGIQAYVFTLFTSLYIGMAIADHEHH